jgi:hypothetical protein
VNREDAEKALGIIRQVIHNTREDLVAHNWGQIWLVHAFFDLAACLVGGYAEWRGWPLIWYMIPFGVNALANLVVAALLARRDTGVRSYVEWQIYGIWVTFMVFTLAGAVVLLLGGAEPWLFGPLLALTSGFGFAMMGVVFSRQFPATVAFLLIALISPLLRQWPGTQWLLIGAAWWCAMFFPGLSMYRELRQRMRDESSARIL